MMLVPLILIGVIVWIVWAMRRGQEHEILGPSVGEKRDPLDIAKERYVRGEISQEEFEQIKRDLS